MIRESRDNKIIRFNYLMYTTLNKYEKYMKETVYIRVLLLKRRSGNWKM